MLERLSVSERKLFNGLGFALLLGIALLLFRPVPSNTVKETLSLKSPQLYGEDLGYRERMEQDLTHILNRIQGVSDVRVLVTLEQGATKILATNETRDKRESEDYDNDGQKIRVVKEEKISSSPITLRLDVERREVPLVTKEEKPVIRGVLVVAKGVDHPDLRYTVAKAVATVLHVPLYKVEVLPN